MRPEFKFLSSCIELNDHRKYMNADERKQNKHITVATLPDEVEDVFSAPETGECD